MKPLSVAIAAFVAAVVVIGGMFLRSLDAPRGRPSRSRLCPRCGLSNEAELARCWSCGGGLPAA